MSMLPISFILAFLSCYLVWYDGRLIHSDVHEPDDVGAVLEVKEDRGVALHHGSLRENSNSDLLIHNGDL